ncbi:hypothetical protein E0Z10_g2229 [Xylaria hypoxylon]|uniref:Uncharacterized protein n=1 Tax=Xylaria hypoxylon TaxID=37992 RepID=A0A4Z0YQC0_9PEZI|nr:hypothetical protein E0Z10_g2229 [Xylaria hypoxylon]
MRTRKIGETKWVTAPPANATISHASRNREYHNDANFVGWSRRVYPNGKREIWKQVEKPEAAVQQANNHLFLVRQYQSAGQPMHWSLAVAPENGGAGKVYQVKGDAVYMHYQHIDNVNIFVSNSYADSRQLCELDAKGEQWVTYVTSHVNPPRAVNQAMVRGNCQDWVVQVIQGLEDKSVVSQGSAASCTSWHDYQSNGARLFG